MKIWTSYFYMVRFLRPYHIVLSTALSDPKWFHAFKGRRHLFIDKNGVLNGLRAESLHPDVSCDGLCSGQPCEFEPESCRFLDEYRKQIFSLDRRKIEASFKLLSERIKSKLGFSEEPEIVLLVHEAPSNPCSERVVLQDFFGCREISKCDIINA